MSEHSRITTIGIFILKFAAFAVVCLFVWWSYLLPIYANAVGQVSARTLIILGEPIEAVSVSVDEEGILKEKTSIVFYKEDTGTSAIHIAFLVNSLPPFIILVLATAGLGLRRRLKIMAIGTGIFFVGHVSWIVIGYKVGALTEVLVAYGQFWLTVPLILWIVLAYWDKVTALFEEVGDTPEEPKVDE